MARIVWKRRNLMKCFFCFGLFAVIATAVAVVSFNALQCSHSVSLKRISALCRLYAAHRVTGDLCETLCIDESLKFRSCLHSNPGKIVYHLSWNDSFDVIMKSKHTDLSDFLTFDFRKIGRDQMLPIPSPSLQREAIVGLVKSRFGKEVNDIIDLDFQGIQRSESDLLYRNQMITKWLLLQQDEYLLLSYLRNHSNIPRLYGSCGHYYVTDFLPPGKYLDNGNLKLKIFPSGWKRRVDLAGQLMDLMQSFAEDFGSPFHFCDMKGSNFGIDLQGKVKPVDVDMAVFEGHLLEIFSQMNCASDSDCEFFDCKGWCISNQCIPVRTNTNMQKLCENIFIGDFWHFISLLSSPPISIRQELTEILNRCKNPSVSQFHALISSKCSSIVGPLSQTINFLPSAEAVECRNAIKVLQTFLTDESRNVQSLLKEILSRGVDT